MNILHYWKMYIFTVRDVDTNINRLYEQWEIYMFMRNWGIRRWRGVFAVQNHPCRIWWLKGPCLGAHRHDIAYDVPTWNCTDRKTDPPSSGLYMAQFRSKPIFPPELGKVPLKGRGREQGFPTLFSFPGGHSCARQGHNTHISAGRCCHLWRISACQLLLTWKLLWES